MNDPSLEPTLGRFNTIGWPKIVAAVLCVLSPMVAQTKYDEVVDPTLARYCHSCHSDRLAEGGLNLTSLSGEGEDAHELASWIHVRERLRAGDMPPVTAKRSLPAESSLALRNWIEKLLAERLKSVSLKPGRVTMRRLSGAEYLTTVRDVVGIAAADLVEAFPADDLGYGFDNIGDALSISRLHFEKYAEAAERIAERGLSLEDPNTPTVRRFDADGMQTTIEDGSDSPGRLFRNGTCSQWVKLPRDGRYLVRAFAFGTQAGSDLPKLVMGVDGRQLKSFNVKEQRRELGSFEIETRLKKGRRRIEVLFVNDFWDPKHQDRTRRDRNLEVVKLEVVGPVDPREPSRIERLVKATDPGAKAGKRRALKFLREFASLAWRRPATKAEVARLQRLMADSPSASGAAYMEALRAPVAAILVSPHFLFRAEAFSRPVRVGKVRPLAPYMIAQRLSYFLWGGPPDGALRELARKKKLSTVEEVRAAAKRMLDDPKAEALGTRFASQWLELSNLNEARPDPDLFPRWSEALRSDLRLEGEQFFMKVLRDGRPLHELLDSSFVMLNERLAAHYGMPGVEGDHLRAVVLPKDRRAGLLRLGAVHVVTSNPSRTSPVKRGKWVLENLLLAPPPPPPPGADSLEDENEGVDGLSLRKRLEIHRKQPECASCHARMDALGFALENFDAIGLWRESSQGYPVDSRATLPDGRVIGNVDDLAQLIKSDPAFIRCLTTKLFIFGVGRDVTPDDEVAIERLLRSVTADTSMKELVLRIVALDAFRRVEGGRK